MPATRSKDAGARTDRELTLKAAAELTGCSGKVLRRYIRDGRLRPASMDGSRMTVTLAALREAGLLPVSGEAHHDATGTDRPAPPAGGEKTPAETARVDDRDRAERERSTREKAEQESAERARVERERAEKESRTRADSARAEKERADKERAEKERAEKERTAKNLAEKEAREQAERARAEKERTEKEAREKAERARAEKESRELAERARDEKERADKERAEKEAREKAERARTEKERAEKERAEKDVRAKAEREKSERARIDKSRAEREKAERERADREAEASKVVPLSRPKPHLEEFDDLADLADLEAASDDDLDERELAALEGELDDLGDPSEGEPETVRLEPEVRGQEARVVSAAERGLVVSGSGPWVTSNQLADLMRLLAAEREARSQEWMDRTESLYREMIEAQKARITTLEEEGRGLQVKLENALRLVPKGENVQALEQMIRDLRIELDRKEASRTDLEHERDRLRDLTDRLRNDLSRAEKRNLEMAEQLRRFRAQGLLDRLVGREPDDR